MLLNTPPYPYSLNPFICTAKRCWEILETKAYVYIFILMLRYEVSSFPCHGSGFITDFLELIREDDILNTTLLLTVRSLFLLALLFSGLFAHPTYCTAHFRPVPIHSFSILANMYCFTLRKISVCIVFHSFIPVQFPVKFAPVLFFSHSIVYRTFSIKQTYFIITQPYIGPVPFPLGATSDLCWTLERECVRTLWMGAPSWERGDRILIAGTGSVSWLRTKEEGRRDT